MKNGTITYATRLTTEIQHFRIFFLCGSVFKNNFTNVLILPFFPLKLSFCLCQHSSLLLWAIFKSQHFHWKYKHQKFRYQIKSFINVRKHGIVAALTPEQRSSHALNRNINDFFLPFHLCFLFSFLLPAGLPVVYLAVWQKVDWNTGNAGLFWSERVRAPLESSPCP